MDPNRRFYRMENTKILPIEWAYEKKIKRKEYVQITDVIAVL